MASFEPDLNDSMMTMNNNDEGGTNCDENQMDTTEPPGQPQPTVTNHIDSTEQQQSDPQPGTSTTTTTTTPGPVVQIQENGIDDVRSKPRPHRIPSLEEFRWNLMLLVLNRFPMGLYFHKIEEEYCRGAGMWIKPEMFLEGATEWKDVFEQTSLKKYFMIKKYVQRFIGVTNYYIVPRVSRSDDEFLEIWENCNFQKVMTYRTTMQNLFHMTGIIPTHQHIYGTYEIDPEKLNSTQILKLADLYGDDEELENDVENSNVNGVDMESGLSGEENQNQESPVPVPQDLQNQINPNIEPVVTTSATTSNIPISASTTTTTITATATTTPTNTITTQNAQQPQQRNEVPVPEKVNEIVNNELEKPKEKEVANTISSVNVEPEPEANANSNKNVLNLNKDNNNSTTSISTSIPKAKQVEDESSKNATTTTKLNNSSINSKSIETDSRNIVNNENLNANPIGLVNPIKRKAETDKTLAEEFEFVLLKKPNMGMGIEEEETKNRLLKEKFKKMIEIAKEKERQENILASVDKRPSNQSTMSSATTATTATTTTSKSVHNKNENTTISSNSSILSKNSNSDVNSQPAFPRASTSASAQTPVLKSNTVHQPNPQQKQQQQQNSSLEKANNSNNIPAQGSNIQVRVTSGRNDSILIIPNTVPTTTTSTTHIIIPQQQQQQQQRPLATPITVSNQAKTTHANTVPTTSTTHIIIPQHQQQKPQQPSSMRINQTPISTAQGRSILGSSNKNITTNAVAAIAAAIITKNQQQQPVVTIHQKPTSAPAPNKSTPISYITKTTNTIIQKQNVPQQQQQKQQQPPTNTQNIPVSNVQNSASAISSTSSSTLSSNTITPSKDTLQQQMFTPISSNSSAPTSIGITTNTTNPNQSGLKPQNKPSTLISSNLTAPTSTTTTTNITNQSALKPQNIPSTPISSNLTAKITTTTTDTTNQTIPKPQQNQNPTTKLTSTTNSTSVPVSSTSISSAAENQTPKPPIVKPAIFNIPQKPSSSSEINAPISTTPPPSSSQNTQDLNLSQLSPTEAKNVSMEKVTKIMNDATFIERITSYIDSLLIYKSDIEIPPKDLLEYKKNFKSIMNNLYTMAVPHLVENKQLPGFITLVSQFVVNEEKCTQLNEWKSRREAAQCLAIMLNTRFKKQSARDFVCTIYSEALNHQKTKVNLASIYGAVKGYCLLGSDAINRCLFPRIREIGHILRGQDQVLEVTEIRKDLSSYLAKEILKSSYDPNVGIDISKLIVSFGSYFTTFIYACMMNAPQFKGNLVHNTLFTINPEMFGNFVHFECEIQSTKFIPYIYLKKTDLVEMLDDPKSWVCVPCNNPLEGPKFLIKEKNKPNQILEKDSFDLSKWIWKEYSPKIDTLKITIPDDSFVLVDITNQTCSTTNRNITHIIDYLSLSQSSHLNLPFKLRNVILNDYRKTLKDMNIEIKKVFPLAEFCENTLKKVQWRPEGEKGLPKMPLSPDPGPGHSQSLTFSGVLFMKIGSDVKYPNEKRIFWNNAADISKLGTFMTMYSNSLSFEGILRKLIEIVGERETKAQEVIIID